MNPVELVRYTTPAGVAQYPRLVEPDKKFHKFGMYSVSLMFEEKDSKELIALIEEEKKKAILMAEENGGRDYKISLPYFDDLENDQVGFRFKQNAGYLSKDNKFIETKVFFFDSMNRPCSPASLWNGSILKINCELYPFYGTASNVGAGVSLRIKAVQILKLVEGHDYNNGASFGFQPVEGAYSADSYSAPQGEQQPQSVGDDDIPF